MLDTVKEQTSSDEEASDEDYLTSDSETSESEEEEDQHENSIMDCTSRIRKLTTRILRPAQNQLAPVPSKHEPPANST